MYKKNNNPDMIPASNTLRGRSYSTDQKLIDLQVTPDRAATMERIRDKTKAKLACAPISYPLATINVNLPHISPPSSPKNQSSSSNQQLTKLQVTPDRAATMERIRNTTKPRLDEIRLASTFREKSFAAIEAAKKNAADYMDAVVLATSQQETANRALINAAEEQAAVKIAALMLILNQKNVARKIIEASEHQDFLNNLIQAHINVTEEQNVDTLIDLVLRQENAGRYMIEAAEYQDAIHIDNLTLAKNIQHLIRATIKAAEKQNFVNIICQALANRQEIAKRAAMEAERQYYARNQLTLQFAEKNTKRCKP